MISIRLADLSDAQRISELLTANGSDRGGMLMGEWPIETIQNRVAAGQPIVVAEDDRLTRSLADLDGLATKLGC